jgi:hypothetical protein
MATTLEHQPLDENTQEFLEQAASSKFDFHQVSIKAAGDEKLKASINNAVMRQHTGRQLRMLELPNADGLRELAGQIKQPTSARMAATSTSRRTAARRRRSSSTSPPGRTSRGASRASRW